MTKKQNNFAFIDSQNLNLGVKSFGWLLDYKKFRLYLREKYNIETAYLFIGFIAQNDAMYSSLQKAGYVLKFKPIISNKDGSHKGNVDADLVVQVMRDCYENHFDQAVIVSSDGDFYSLVNFLYERKRLCKVISPYHKTCSTLLKNSAKEKIVFMDNLRAKLEYKKKSTA